MNTNIVNIVSNSLVISITGKKKNPIKSTTPHSDIKNALQTFWNKLKVLKDKLDTQNKEIDSLEKVYIEAAPLKKKPKKKLQVEKPKTSSKDAPKEKKATVQNYVKLIESKLGIIKEVSDNLEDAQSLYAQLKDKYSNVKAATKLLSAAKSMVAELERSLEKVRKTINLIAKQKSPGVLTTKNDIIDKLFKYILKDFSNIDSKPKPKLVKTDDYTIDSAFQQGIKFARYIELNNLPKIDGSKIKKMYLVLTVNLAVPRQKKGAITGDFSHLFLTLAPYKVQPSRVKLYRVDSIKDITNVLAFLARENGLDVFNTVLNINIENKLEKLKDKLPILTSLGKKNILLKKDRILVRVPIDKADLGEDDTNPQSQWYKDLFIEIKKFAGLPMNPPKGRFTTDRLKLNKITKKGKNYILSFTVLPVSPISELEAEEPEDKNDAQDKFLKDLDLDTSDSSSWLETLKKEADKYLKGGQ